MCKGAKPIFRERARVIIVVGRGWVIKQIFHCPVSHALVMLANSIVAAAVDWTKKYFVAASVARGWWVCVIKGIIARVLSSKPIHARSQ